MSGICKSQVSRLCEEIDQRVKAFLDRPIEAARDHGTHSDNASALVDRRREKPNKINGV